MGNDIIIINADSTFSGVEFFKGKLYTLFVVTPSATSDILIRQQMISLLDTYQIQLVNQKETSKIIALKASFSELF